MNSQQMTVKIRIDGKTTEVKTRNQTIEAKMGNRMDVLVTNNTDFPGVAVITYNKVFDVQDIGRNSTTVFKNLHTLEEDYTIGISLNVKRVLDASGTRDVEIKDHELSFRVVNP